MKIVAGKTWSAFGDQGARPNSLAYDYAPAGSVFRKDALQFRATMGLSDYTSATFAIESPINDDFVLVNATDVRLQRTPNFVGKVKYEPTVGIDFIELGTMLRTLGVEDTGFNEQVEFGWGISLIASKRIHSRDRLQFGFVSGEGIGDYIYGLRSQLAAGGPNGTQLRALSNTGAYLGYHKRWAENWASNAAYGYAYADTTSTMPTDAISKVQNAWVNLVYRPSNNLAVAIEYNYGMREVRDGTLGENNRIQFTFTVGDSRSAIGGTAIPAGNGPIPASGGTIPYSGGSGLSRL